MPGSHPRTPSDRVRRHKQDCTETHISFATEGIAVVVVVAKLEALGTTHRKNQMSGVQ